MAEAGVYSLEFALSVESYDKFVLAATEAGATLEEFLRQAMSLRVGLQQFIRDNCLAIYNPETEALVMLYLETE